MNTLNGCLDNRGRGVKAVDKELKSKRMMISCLKCRRPMVRFGLTNHVNPSDRVQRMGCTYCRVIIRVRRIKKSPDIEAKAKAVGMFSRGRSLRHVQRVTGICMNT